MSINLRLRVHIASYYDLATPHFATDYIFKQLEVEPELRGNLEFSYYEAGHTI